MMPSHPVTPPSIIGDYKPPQARYDEMLADDGSIRPQWQRLLQGLDALGMGELQSRDEMLNRLIHENGITYNIYQADESSKRAWMMDLLPTLIEYNEWQWIESALCQRVRLFNQILADIYGEQRLLQERRLPLPLVYNNPAFLRPCHALKPASGIYIHLYAVDLARSPDGRWWVLSDRIEAPSGIGYALENRFITASVLPEVFRNCGVMRLQPFFQKMRESFERLVPRMTEDPSIVMLTPGPAHETYYEQSFLARNLGYPLVEGSDLTVRDHCVYLKTVSGMERVDVIIRRVDSEFCDPLELRGDSLLGVPGLVHAARMGNVIIANSLGSGFLQTPALSAFLPTLCQHLLGEDLHMPSVATWWCGQPRERAYVLENMERLVIKPVFRKRHGEAVFGQLASKERLEHLRRLIEKSPESWCAQEQVAQATTPVFDRDILSPRHFLLRVFLVENNGEYSMMPGGLTRITSNLSSFSVSVQEGGQSQDTWMLTEGGAPTADIPLPNTGPVRIQRQTADLPSRAADNIFWFGRYMERCEQTVRVIRMLMDVVIQEAGEMNTDSTGPFIDMLLPDELSREILPEQYAGPLFPSETEVLNVESVEKALAKQLWDMNSPGSLVQNLAGLHRTAFVIKERLSVDMWHGLNKLRDLENSASARYRKHQHNTTHPLNELLLTLSSINGGISENMTRAHDWRFLDLGRRIERGINIAALLQYTLVSAPHDSRRLLNYLLIAADSSYTYRGRYLTNLQLCPLLDLLLADETNPRSLVYQIICIREQLRELPYPEREAFFSRAEKIGLRAYTRLRLADMSTLESRDQTGRRKTLNTLLEETIHDLADLSTLLGQIFFAHGETGKLLNV